MTPPLFQMVAQTFFSDDASGFVSLSMSSCSLELQSIDHAEWSALWEACRNMFQMFCVKNTAASVH